MEREDNENSSRRTRERQPAVAEGVRRGCAGRRVPPEPCASALEPEPGLPAESLGRQAVVGDTLGLPPALVWNWGRVVAAPLPQARLTQRPWATPSWDPGADPGSPDSAPSPPGLCAPGRRASEFTGGKQRGLAAGSPAGPRSWRGPQSPPGTLAKPAPNLLTNQLELEARSWALQNLKPETELPSPCAWHGALWPSEEWHLSWVCTPASRVPREAAACPRQNQLHVGSSLTESELPPPTTQGNLTVLGGSPGVREHVLNPLLRTKLAQASTLPV